ncbi:MAG: PatB family C-S lyase [Deinococcota bacterium]
MSHPFDAISLETLRTRKCAKWTRYGPDVMPLWVADMDFPASEKIIAAMNARASSDNLGYPMGGYLGSGEPGIGEAIMKRQAERYNWHFEDENIWLINGIVPGLFLGAMAFASPGEEVIMQTPIYPPFMYAVEKTGRTPIYNQMEIVDGTWQIDFDALDALVTPNTRLFMLCNPHNPVGRVFRRDELEKLGEFVLKHRLWVVSDELHCDLRFDDYQHIPFASLSDELAQRTVTLFGPTKTFNIAGLKGGVAVSQNKALLERYQNAAPALITPPNVIAQAAIKAAYNDEAQDWLDSTLSYLDGNRKFIADFVSERLPSVKYYGTEGTYLSWLDFRSLGLGEQLETFLLETCKVGLNPGPSFGPGGEGFARLNFATTREVIEHALTRIEDGIRQLD